jgi:hypothetical protein
MNYGIYQKMDPTNSPFFEYRKMYNNLETTLTEF